MFDAHQFDISECLYYSVYDITIAENNRPHKHEHVENGISDYTRNWELVEVDDGLRRGSAQLYLVEDRYWISCSRTGLERSGNAVKFSSGCPEELVFKVVSAVFEGVLRRNSVDISEGFKKDEFFNSDGLKVATPKELVLARECNQQQIADYYDKLSDLLYELIEQYNEAKTVEDVTRSVDQYRELRKSLYRDAIDFEPSIVSEVVSNMSGKNGWIIDEKDMDGAKKHHLIRHKNNGDDDEIFYIEIIGDSVVQIIDFVEDVTLARYEYSTEEELQEYVADLMEFNFEDMKQ